ncbi:MAG: cobaltochelatase subunit CobN [Gemmatimonadaceae bacterium]|nr:cobaltochelatase subunit CobN [Gemmatimonadaceae bacterium]
MSRRALRAADAPTRRGPGHFESLSSIACCRGPRDPRDPARARCAATCRPRPAATLVRTPKAVLPTGRNLYGFDPYKVPSPYALKEGAARAEQLIARHVADGNDFPETVAFVLWGTDNMKSEGTQLAQVLALMGVVPRFDAVGPPRPVRGSLRSSSSAVRASMWCARSPASSAICCRCR